MNMVVLRADWERPAAELMRCFGWWMSILSKIIWKFVFTLFLFTGAAYFGRECGIDDFDTTVTGAKKRIDHIFICIVAKLFPQERFPKILLFARGSC